MWSAIYDGFVAGDEVVLGEDCCRQPDWLKESAPCLQPLISLLNSQGGCILSAIRIGSTTFL